MNSTQNMLSEIQQFTNLGIKLVIGYKILIRKEVKLPQITQVLLY